MAAHQAPCPWDSPGKNTGVSCHLLLQYIFHFSQILTFTFFFIWEGLGEPQETEPSMLVLMVVYSVCVSTSLGFFVALKERRSRRKNMGVGFPIGLVVKNLLQLQETR